MAANDREEDALAYGEYHGRAPADEGENYPAGGDRGIIGDTYRRWRDRHQPQPMQNQNYGAPYGQSENIPQTYQPNPYSNNNPTYSSHPPNRPNGGPGLATGLAAGLFDKLHGAVHGLGSEVAQKLQGLEDVHTHTHGGAECGDGMHDASHHRYGSFAPQRGENDAKWYVDGCGYMWAVSRALEQARESIWILDWWLSPELYLRRPPSQNEQYRIDRMLLAAAQRGVKVNIIVYKEVTQALTRKYLSPTLPSYLHSLLPRSTDPITSWMSRMGLGATFLALEQMEARNPLIPPPVTVSSSHTKHALEDLHFNIAVFRHPDHLPDAQTLQSSFLSSIQNLSLNAAQASKLPASALQALYGMNEDVILYWAHHEKLCLVDSSIAFMGGLDLCYGRWDTNQHAIADAHPGNLDDIVFPGQDFNNARMMDFSDVAHWENNKLDRKSNSRMGWSDISICLRGPVVEDLRAHFVERWNFIYNEKYDVRRDTRYSKLTFTQNAAGMAQPHGVTYDQPPQPTYGSSYVQQQQQHGGGASYASAQNGTPYFPPPPVQQRGLPDYDGQAEEADGQFDERARYGGGRHHHHHMSQEINDTKDAIRGAVSDGMQHMQGHHRGGNENYSQVHGHFQDRGISCQIVRSCTRWSHGTKTEHSIADAYIDVIRNSQHFVYIENQFFITATSDAQKPIKNKIGAALVERILRAARAGQRYKVIVLMPAIPAFAGDLKDESSLGTRAIMEFQYNSINRGGHSIMETIANEGFDPMEYIRFYNLRNYDRINASASMREVEQRSGVDYEDARREHDDSVDPMGYQSSGGGIDPREDPSGSNYLRYQQAAQQISTRRGSGSGRWDSVSECYMLGGMDIRDVPWENGELSEIEAFVSEELYIHSKVLIADDRIVICGSANLNDRSQLGYHDSEIAIVIEDNSALDSYMNGQPWRATKYAATLRRQLFRKHLGLLPPQDFARPDQNFEPVGVPNAYDFGSAEDAAVVDPLSDEFLYLWNSCARQNTEVFGRVFHPVPHDAVRNWQQYDAFYENFFHESDRVAQGKGSKIPPKYRWGHVVADSFSPGAQGAREVKDLLSGVRGTLVEMPLLFLIEEDIAKEGVSLNALTEEVYT